MSTVAGGYGYADGVGTAAKFRSPYGISVDSTGNVWISDEGNYVIRKINTAGNVLCFKQHVYKECNTHLIYISCRLG